MTLMELLDLPGKRFDRLVKAQHEALVDMDSDDRKFVLRNKAAAFLRQLAVYANKQYVRAPYLDLELRLLLCDVETDVLNALYEAEWQEGRRHALNGVPAQRDFKFYQDGYHNWRR